MKDVRSIVRNFLNDDTVREKKPYSVPPVKVKAVDNVAPQEKTVGSVVERLPPPVARQSQAPIRETMCQYTDDHKHKWEWRQGVKQCWVCGDPAPLDRRDSTTGWNGKTSKR